MRRDETKGIKVRQFPEIQWLRRRMEDGTFRGVALCGRGLHILSAHAHSSNLTNLRKDARIHNQQLRVTTRA